MRRLPQLIARVSSTYAYLLYGCYIISNNTGIYTDSVHCDKNLSFNAYYLVS